MPFAGGFNLAEGLDLLALCSIVEGSTELPQPPGWTMMFDSPVIPPFTEKWQLWQNASGSYAIVVRGTVYDPGSILEDLLAFLAHAVGSVTVGPYRIDYKFAADPHASVNVGFTLGALLLLKDPVAFSRSSRPMCPREVRSMSPAIVRAPPSPPSCVPIFSMPRIAQGIKIIHTRPMSTPSQSLATITIDQYISN